MKPASKRFGFPRWNRLVTAAGYRKVFGKPYKTSDPCFTVLSRASGETSSRLGLAISKKMVRRAVDRNRIKRCIRESYRIQKELLSGLDLVVLARNDTKAKTSSELTASLAKHWQNHEEAKRKSDPG